LNNLGVVVPIVTPCSKSGIVDYDGLLSVCEDMTGAGCSAVFIAGSTGRGPWFSLKEKAAICSGVKNHIDDAILLFAGCTASGISDMLEHAMVMKDAGADIAVITIPTYFKYNPDEISRVFLEFADKSPLPVLIYDIPVFSGMKLDNDIVYELVKHQNVIGLKDSSSDMERFKELLSKLEDRKNIYLLQGKEHLLAESILLKASGLVVSLLHIDPRPFVSLYRAAISGNKEKAYRMQDAITEVMEAVVYCFSLRPETSTLFHILNNCLKIRGVCGNIILGHEGECPDWLVEKSAHMLEIFRNLADI